MNNVMEACDRIRDYLSKWYNDIKHNIDFSRGFKHNRRLQGFDLWDAKRDFIKLNPEYEKFDFDIIVGFDVDVSSWQPRSICSDGCCSFEDCMARMKCRGILVMPVDWEQTRKLALVA